MPLRVLHVIETLGPGGAERVLLTLLPELSRCGIQVEVAALYGPYDLSADLEAAGVRVTRLDLPHRWAFIRSGRALSDITRRFQPDIVHAHLGLAALHVGTAPLGRRTKRVETFHNLGYTDPTHETPPQRARRQFHRLLSRTRFDSRAAVSTAAAEAHRAQLGLGARHIPVIPNPLSATAFEWSGPGSDLGPDPSSLRVVLPGRLIAEKGHVYAIDASRILMERGVRFSMEFVGEGPLRPTIEREVARQGVGSHVLLSGQLPHERTLDRIARADLVIAPSVSEGFCVAIAEAMALGRAVIVAKSGGLTDLVESGVTGLQIPARDARALADAITTLGADAGERARLGAAARADARARFDVAQVARKWQAYYRTVLG